MRSLPAIVALACAGCATPTGEPGPAELPPAVPPADPAPALPGPDLDPPPALVINEIAPANMSLCTDEALDADDWIELYNADILPVSLDGWALADDDDPDWYFPYGLVLEPGEHLVVWVDGEPEEGLLHATFRLDADDDAVYLFAPDERVADSWTFADHPDDVVLGRFPSGGVFRASSIVATPGNGNPLDPGLSLDPSDALFPVDEVVRLDLYLAPDAHQALRDDSYAEVEASLGFEGMFLPRVALRIKGGIGSHREIDEKAAFRLNLDTFVPGQRLRGLEHLTLNNMVQDPSGVHELLAYQLFREAGVPASRAAHVALYLNGAYRGLYLNVETVDDQLLERWFADPNGNLYEGIYGQDVTEAHVWALDLDEQGANDVTDRSELAALAELMAQPPSEALMPELEARVDLDRTLRMFAGEVVLAHWDGYFFYPNNYRVYHEPTLDQWTVIPSGLDQTFGWSSGIYDANGAIAEWCLAVPSCRVRYDLALWEMADRMAQQDCRATVADALDRILPLYTADPFREGTPAGMESSAEAAVDFCESRPDEILAELF